MKNLLSNFSLFIILAVVFSSLTGCGTTTNSQMAEPGKNMSASSANAATPADSANSAVKSSEYPLLPTAIMQADIKRLDGSIYKVEDLKGKVVVFNLWATWCGPCRAEMPELVAMEDEFKEKGLKIVGLNVDDETEEQIKPFAEQMKLNYELAWADTRLNSELLKISKFNGIPQSFLIDRKGRLRGVFVGGSPRVIKQLRENVEKVVAE